MQGLGTEARDLVRQFLDAFDRADIAAILAMLAEDATFEMPRYPNWCRGRAALAASWLMPDGPPPRLRHIETSANGQPAAGVYVLDPDQGLDVPVCLDVLTLRGPRIADVTAFRMPELFRLFGPMLSDARGRTRGGRRVRSAGSALRVRGCGRTGVGRPTRRCPDLLRQWLPTRVSVGTAATRSSRPARRRRRRVHA
jgi:SnoaL-like domain